MRCSFVIVALCLPLVAGAQSGAPVSTAPAQEQVHGQVVDRIAARVEGDIIALSEVRELAAYQQLMDGRSDPEPRLIDELIEQWAINNEAQAADFSPPAGADVDRALADIQGRFPNPQAFAQRLAELGLTPGTLRTLVTRQIYLTRYLDYRFRPAVQVDDDAIAKYYKETLAPALVAKQQTVPPLEEVAGQIREVLVTQSINERSAAWLQDTKARMKIEIEPAAGAVASNAQ